MHRINIFQVCQNISNTWYWVLCKYFTKIIYTTLVSIFSVLSLCVSKCVAWKIFHIYFKVCISTLVQHPDNYISRISEIQVSARQFTQYQFSTIPIHVCSLEAPETNWLPFRVTAGFATSLGGNAHNDTRLPGQPESTYRGPYTQNTHPCHYGVWAISTYCICPVATHMWIPIGVSNKLWP